MQLNPERPRAGHARLLCAHSHAICQQPHISDVTHPTLGIPTAQS
jgi:hypothetical protein